MRLSGLLGAMAVMGALCLQPVAGAQAQDFIAGTTPDRRPEGAPVIGFFPKTTEWHVSALRGVSRPYPRSFSFLDNQGAWYNPFQHPGMTSGYDLRNYHK